MRNPFCLSRLVSAAFFALLLPLMGVSIQMAISSYQRYAYTNHPIENYFQVHSVFAHDVNLKSGNRNARIEIHRESKMNFVGTRSRSLIQVGLQPVRPDVNDPSIPTYETIIVGADTQDVVLDSGNKVVVIIEDIRSLIDGKELENDGQYYWVINYNILFPYNIQRSVLAKSNMFSIVR